MGRDTFFLHHGGQQCCPGRVKLARHKPWHVLKNLHCSTAFDKPVRRFKAEYATANDRHLYSRPRVFQHAFYIVQGAQQAHTGQIRAVERRRVGCTAVRQNTRIVGQFLPGAEQGELFDGIEADHAGLGAYSNVLFVVPCWRVIKQRLTPYLLGQEARQVEPVVETVALIGHQRDVDRWIEPRAVCAAVCPAILPPTMRRRWPDALAGCGKNGVSTTSVRWKLVAGAPHTRTEFRQGAATLVTGGADPHRQTRGWTWGVCLDDLVRRRCRARLRRNDPAQSRFKLCP